LLTLDHSSDDVEAQNHSCDTSKRLLASSNEVEHVTTAASHDKGPTAHNDIDLRFCFDFGDTCLGEDLVQVEPVIMIH